MEWSLIQSAISHCQKTFKPSWSCVLNSPPFVSSAQRDDGCRCTAVWCRVERNRRVRAAQWDCCAGERVCFHCGGMCLLSFKYPSRFGGVFHFVWFLWSSALCSFLHIWSPDSSKYLRLLLSLIHLSYCMCLISSYHTPFCHTSWIINGLYLP